ncbi:MAG: UPF0261 family protein, partial [Actinobacteria bacterium]|nr:UPF0261 family protein [Actinomycetota bacterium]
MAKTVIIMGTLNTKENEGQYIRKQIERFGHDTVFIDISLRRSQPKLKNGDIPNAAVAEAAGASIEEIEKLERMPAINVVVKGATRIIKDLYKNKKVDGIIGFGGSMGESISALIEKTLPVNIPKALVTTTLKLAADSVGPKNICIFPTLTDMNGKINKINAITLAHAASAIAGMVNSLPEIPEDKKIIAATQYGNTTPHIEVAKEVLESKGYDF